MKESIRLKNNSSEINNIFTDVTFKYEPIKLIEIAAGFRFIQKKKKNDYQFDFRNNLDVSFKHKANDFKFKHRVRYTNKNELGVKISEGDEVNHELRFLTEFGYNIPKCKLNPYLNAELFNLFESGEKVVVDKIRLKLGANYDFDKAGSIGFFVGYERLFQEDELNNISIVGLNYNFGIKTWKKKDD